MAAAPVSSAAGAGPPRSGLPRWLIATAQCAMAQSGSIWVTAVNAFVAWGNQKGMQHRQRAVELGLRRRAAGDREVDGAELVVRERGRCPDDRGNGGEDQTSTHGVPPGS